MQKDVQKSTEQDLFNTRAENSRLYSEIYDLQTQLERLSRTRRTGKVAINVKELLLDLQFMDFAGETHAMFVYEDDKYVKLDSLETVKVPPKVADIW